MADYAVSTVFKGKDGITDKLSHMGAAANKFGRDSSNAFNKASRSGLSFKKLVAGIFTANILSRGVGLLTQGIRKAGSEFIAFDDAITAAAAKFGGIERGTRMFDKLKTSAREVGAVTEFTSAQAAEGLRFLAKAGYEPVFAMKALKSFVDLATGSETEFARATDIATDVVGAFRLNVGSTEDKLKGLIRVNDVMTKAVNMANIDMEDLFETIKMAGPAAVDAGISIEKFSAIAAFMGGAGIKASLAGTAMRTAIVALTAPVPKARAEFKKLGIQLMDSKKNMRDPIAIFEDLRKKMDKMGTSQRNATMALLFGKRAMAGASVSIAGGSAALEKFQRALENSKGESAKLANLMRQSLGKRLAALESAAIELAFKFLDAFEYKFPGAIDAATEAIRKFDIKKVTDTIGDVIAVIKDLRKAAKPLEPLIWSMAVGWVVYKGALTAITTIEAIRYFAQLAKATKAAAGAQSMLNVAMTANPIGVVIMAVAGLVAAGVMLYKQWDNIKLLFKFWWEDTKSILRKFGRFVASTMEYVSRILKKVIDPLDVIPLEGIKNVLREVWAFLREQFAGIGKFLKKAIDPLGLFGGEGGKVPKPPVTKPAATKPIEKITKEQLGALGMPMPTVTAKQSPVVQRQRIELARQEVARQKAQVEKQKILFEGRLQIAGAPPGSKMESKTIGAPPIRVEGLGVNP